jgi:GntR family transcriptional regulator
MPKLQTLDRDSAVPLYYQIQQRLLRQIQDGVYETGQPLPSAREIALNLGVNHLTVRQAIKSLCLLGLLYSKQGRGTFISGMKLEKNVRQVLSFSEEMQHRKSRCTSKVLQFEERKANAQVAEALRCRWELSVAVCLFVFGQTSFGSTIRAARFIACLKSNTGCN